MENLCALSLTHTLVNVKFLHKSEDVFDEQFGLGLAHAVFGQSETRELPVETNMIAFSFYFFLQLHTHGNILI